MTSRRNYYYNRPQCNTHYTNKTAKQRQQPQAAAVATQYTNNNHSPTTWRTPHNKASPRQQHLTHHTMQLQSRVPGIRTSPRQQPLRNGPPRARHRRRQATPPTQQQLTPRRAQPTTATPRALKQISGRPTHRGTTQSTQATPPQQSQQPTQPPPQPLTAGDNPDILSAPPPWEQAGWGGNRQGGTSTRRTEANAGHGSQRVQNKAGKYTYKQHNKWGNPQRRPPPQQQQGPGWGVLYTPQPRQPTMGRPTPSQPQAGGPSNSDTPPTGDKAHNEAKEKFKRLLNLHLLPRDSPPPDSTKPTPIASEEGDGTPDPTAASSGQTPVATDVCTEDPTPNTGDTHVHTEAELAELAIQAEWAAGQDSCLQMDEEDIPPEVPLSANSHADVTQLPLGCWRVRILADHGVFVQRVAGKPRTVLLHDGGPVLTAPPLPIGLVGVLAPMTSAHWMLKVEEVPLLSRYEGGAMLLAEGDILIFENTCDGWIVRVDKLSPDCGETVARLRQTLQTNRQRASGSSSGSSSSGDNKPSQSQHPHARGKTPQRRDPSVPPELTPIAEMDDEPSPDTSNHTHTETQRGPGSSTEQHTSAGTQSTQPAASSTDPPRSYYPPGRSTNRGTPTATTATDQPQRPSATHPLQDGRTLRKGQTDRLPEQQPSQPTQPAGATLAELLSDGRNIGRRNRRYADGGQPQNPQPKPAPAPNTPPPPPAPRADLPESEEKEDEDDGNSLMQTIPPTPSNNKPIPEDHPGGQVGSTLQQTPTTPNPSPPEDGDTHSPLALPGNPLPPQQQHATTSSGHRGDSSAQPPRQRSWERVQGHLNEIRQIAETFGNSQGEAIARTAEIALVDLLVDTPTAEALDQAGGSQSSQPPTRLQQQHSRQREHSAT